MSFVEMSARPDFREKHEHRSSPTRRAPDLADRVESTRIGRFEVEGNIFGDQRQWAEARWDRVGPEVAEALMAEEPTTDPEAYAFVLTPRWDMLAESVVTPLP